ncbi:ferredoxin [Mycolicibacterium sp. P9-64]|uniref:ferredoxin n=1 Tax=Mycolicibacterium sp. P9-64 TaxID=2024612 RepID=UPI001F5BF7DD|nr:ferredoxin [Mycolicibacterium sp. P9-64]
MTPVNCRTCGAEVLARKGSWQQTSVQWTADAVARCWQRRNADALSAHGSRGLLIACSYMDESIENEARCGRLPVVDEMAQPVH